MLWIDYRAVDGCAILHWSDDAETAAWLPVLRRVALDASDEARQEGPSTISVPWWNFVAIRDDLAALFRGYGVRLGIELELSESASILLRQSRERIAQYSQARTVEAIPAEQVQSTLARLGFRRVLSAEQVRNVGRLAALPAGATFSVPGAGKTTEALAFYFLRAHNNQPLLIVAPKNAFAAWDEQLELCAPLGPSFVRLRGGRSNIQELLDANPRFAIITYQQLVRVRDVVSAYCARNAVHLFLDESHRIKSGVERQTARAALALSHLPISKLIMTGTPMPQSTEDLIPQLAFLYPEVRSTSDTVVDLIRSIYVRTTKAELGLPPIDRELISLPMAPLQRELYRLMKFEVARDAAAALGSRGRQTFRTLGRSVARLLMFVSNPSLLGADIGFAKPELLAGVIAEGDGPKIQYVLRRARKLAVEGKKVLIWTSFRRNVEYLADRLVDQGAVFIHGGVDAGDEDDDGTREGKVKLFHDDPNVMVLVANPAAAGEGVSLHTVCHHAIYLDRTFNAAHYLQSEDRIHRFGLAPDQLTTIEIVECEDSIDETVRTRLNFKIGRMAQALNDASLRPDPIALDPSDIEDYEEYGVGLTDEDVQALLQGLEADV